MPTRLLLADDEAYVTAVLSQKLAPLFDEIVTASDGDEALSLARLAVPTLVVSDYQMPVVDGYTLARALRSDPLTAEVPVILLTARGHLLTAEQLALTNVRRTLAKPFSVREVVAAVRAILPSFPSERAA